MFKPVDDFDNDRKGVRILVWGDGTTEQCALIKNIETCWIDQIESKNPLL